MYTLIGSPATRAFRVVWCLEELGLDYEIVPAAPGGDDIKNVNPSGKVPALIVKNDNGDDDVIIDSVAICQYLADKHNGLTYPAGTIERAKMDSFIHLAVDEFDHACWVWAKHDWIYPEGLKAENVKPACALEFKKAMQHLEERLGDNKYVMGDTFTVPDILLGQCAGWATNMCKFEIPDGKVADYFKRVTHRKAFVKAMRVRNA
ncbi:MAG: glutathione S-transferase family protein [Robiginitomaculum sp.]|nr:glutathione S-transferase family protein [Robiginitomaculum sp.]